jgi:hypothetical protein
MERKKHDRLSFDDLRECTRHIFDLNERTMLEESAESATGLMGRFNRMATARRQKAYFRKIRSGFRIGANQRQKLIVAEGDSWFNFPVFIKDILDWLGKDPDYAVYSIASAGDWIANIIYEGKYVEELSIHAPDAFLISGSGNDLVSRDRVAVMVDKTGAYTGKYVTLEQREELSRIATVDEYQAIMASQPYITNAFYSFLMVIKAQYWLMFSSIAKSEVLKDMQIITQAYDYPIPSFKRHWWPNPVQGFVNALVGTGKWLAEPLSIKGIPEIVEGRNNEKINLWQSILKMFIFEINQVFISIANAVDPVTNQAIFKNLYHVDARGTARNKNDWYDELHLKSHRFKEVAEAYKSIINGQCTDKIIRVSAAQPESPSEN